MHLIPTLALVDKVHVSVLDALPHLAGMLMVMITLTILWGVCAFTAKLIQVLMPPAAPAAEAGQAAADTIPPEILAVIAAAISTVGGKKVRIVSIKPQSSSWEKAGRQSVLSSHRIR
jgi:Na+-transporting methylmalonyl-CoA/oxaloacetate decarboxylase gamma subunit